MMAENANLFSIREGTGKGGQRRGQGREGGGQFENEETRLWLRLICGGRGHLCCPCVIKPGRKEGRKEEG